MTRKKAEIKKLQPPDVEKEYGEWTVEGKPLQILVKKKGASGYQNKWMVPCKCSCGRRDLVSYQNLRLGLSKGCIVCGNHTPRNSKRPTFYEAFGESKSLKQWAEDDRCPYCAGTLRKRIQSGLTLEEAITYPQHHGKLTNEKVLEIYRRVHAGEKIAELGKEFNVHESNISCIKTGKTYRRVTKAFGWKADDLPEWDEIGRKRGEDFNPIEEFIFENEPADKDSETFRIGLLNLINFVLEERKL